MSICLSNVGNVVMPKELDDYIDRFEFLIGPQKFIDHAMTAISFNGTTLVSFTRTIKNSTVERDFFKVLVEHGIDVTINTNRGYDV